ncbi:hypothetical protein M413DRAFT_21749 [Hebeloma cylindrosporum]|uniref:F-box domain-containing protein n=1 Tax=Hebeloma cylindrosporum TaxID=76867 RepID=A0A0C2YIG7_HEBCY|nr:hypothetical protein M413DRAFT_21749 [Hebeloma cylindrosporum h7]
MGKAPLSYLETTEDESMYSDVPTTSTKPVRGRKRKNPETATKEPKVTGRANAKRARGNRGILKELVEMPLDVLFEIFGCLEPIDLLQLSWTSKALRALLMNRTSASLWRQTFQNLPSPHPPECPDDLNEPQYTELLFRKACHFCGKSIGTIHVAWAARLRSCTKCLDIHLQRMGFEIKPYGHLLQRLLPRIELKKKYGQHKRGTAFACPKIDRAWIDQYESIDSTSAKRVWLEETMKRQTVIEDHAKACEEWSEIVQRRLEGQKGKVIDDRREQVREYIRDLGWGEELDLLKSWHDRPERIPIVDRAGRKELTDSVLGSLEQPLITFMEGAKARRLDSIHMGIASKRLNDLRAVRQAWVETLPANSIYPTSSELMRLPFVKDIFDNLSKGESLTEANLESVRLELDDLNVEWQENIKNELVEIASKGYEDDPVDPETVLTLATTFFACKTCYRVRLLRYPNILMHKCATTLDWQSSHEGEPEARFLKRHFQETFWNAKGHIVCEPAHRAFVVELVRLAGLDPVTATAGDMDAVDPIFECVPCNSVTKGRATMSWKTAVDHRFASDQHRDSTVTVKEIFKPVLLDESEASVVRPRMREEKERKLRDEEYNCYRNGMVCTRCKKTGNFLLLWKHFREEHKISNPTDEDIVPGIDSASNPPLYRHWPPRPADEVEGDDD